MVELSATPLRHWRRFLPLFVLAIVVALVVWSGVHRQLSFDTLAVHYAQFAQDVQENPLIAGMLAVLLYMGLVAFSIPGVWILTVAYGLIFGWLLAVPLVVLGASLGAFILFWAAGHALAGYFRTRAGPYLSGMAQGFRDNAANYLLFLRLAPLFPFTLINVAPAILGVKFKTFAWTTVVGIIPGTVAYAFAGEGLRSIVEDRARACALGVAPCGTPLKPSDILTHQVMIALVLLAAVALIPVLVRWARSR
jgi:uncharacterized membrane protein YdjX (TVP38/TMEM64 family)